MAVKVAAANGRMLIVVRLVCSGELLTENWPQKLWHKVNLLLFHAAENLYSRRRRTIELVIWTVRLDDASSIRQR